MCVACGLCMCLEFFSLRGADDHGDACTHVEASGGVMPALIQFVHLYATPCHPFNTLTQQIHFDIYCFRNPRRLRLRLHSPFVLLHARSNDPTELFLFACATTVRPSETEQDANPVRTCASPFQCGHGGLCTGRLAGIVFIARGMPQGETKCV